MNKRNKMLVILLFVFILIAVFAISIKITRKNVKEFEEKEFEKVELSQRILINQFLQDNPYISDMEDFQEGLINDKDIVKSAIYSNNVKLDYIITEEIEKNDLLSRFEGYKKSIDNIKKYAKEVFKKDIEMNFIETYFNDSGYLLINDRYVFFTKKEQ